MDNVQAVLKFGLAGFSSYQQIMAKIKADGKWQLADAALLLGPALQIPALVAAVPAAAKEWENSSEDDRASIDAFIKANVPQADALTSEKVNAAMDIIVLAGVFFKKAAAAPAPVAQA